MECFGKHSNVMSFVLNWQNNTGMVFLLYNGFNLSPRHFLKVVRHSAVIYSYIRAAFRIILYASQKSEK